MLSLKIDKMKVSQWTCCDTIIRFGHALLPYRYAAFFSHGTQPGSPHDWCFKGKPLPCTSSFFPHFLNCFGSKTLESWIMKPW